MAAIFMSESDASIRVWRAGETAKPWQAVQVNIGGCTIALSREEAAQFAADLLNAAKVEPVDAGVPA